MKAKEHDEIHALLSVDWNFTNVKSNYATHGLHPYPAKFIPQIPRALIENLSHDRETIADIFSGSGTALVEGMLLGRSVVGVDANPLACLITRGKTARITKDDVAALLELVHEVLTLRSMIADAQLNFLTQDRLGVSLDIPQDQKTLDFWFMPHVVEELGLINGMINRLPEPAKVLAKVCFSSIIVAVSKQDSDTRYVRREKNIPIGDTLLRFARIVKKSIARSTAFSENVSPNVSSLVIDANVLDKPEMPPVGLVVTSPPYPNAYSYHLYHRTRMIWLGMDSDTFKRQEIGSHRKYSRKGENRATVETFFAEMVEVFTWIKSFLSRDRYAVFVVGNSTLNGKVVENHAVVTEAARWSGFSLATVLSRDLQSTRKAFNPSIGKIKQEQIVVLKNDGRGR